jgi:hypothetical protein
MNRAAHEAVTRRRGRTVRVGQEEETMARRRAVGPAAELARHLAGIKFPARKKDIVEHAKGKGANAAMVDSLNSLPEREYRTMAEVMKGFGQVR